MKMSQNSVTLPGYNFENLDRGGHQELSAQDKSHLASFLKGVGQVFSGELKEVTQFQLDARSGYGESYRDELMHKLGINMNFDLDGLMTENEEHVPCNIGSANREKLGMLSPSIDRSPLSVYRRVNLNSTDNGNIIKIEEVEFEATIKQSDKLSNTWVRVIRCLRIEPAVPAE